MGGIVPHVGAWAARDNSGMSISRHQLLQAFDGLLQPERFKDYGPNGLQVEGKAEIQRVVSGVTASRALIEAAIAARADAIFVHHGLFWRGQDGRITGWMKQRLQLLLAHDINLFGYHLPLDAHAELGNNAQLGRVLGFAADARFGEQDLGFSAPAVFGDGQALADHVAQALGRAVTLVQPAATGGVPSRPVRRVAWCTGGAQGYFESAIAAQADAIFVHHGLFWRGQDGRITGWMKQRLQLLLAHDINLFGYHLPLDAHAELGNNAQLGRVLGFAADARFGEQDLGFSAPAVFGDGQALADHVAQALGRAVTLVQPAATGGVPSRPVRRVAWCTGGAQGYFESAIAAGADAFITGEISEPQAHLAREMGVSFIAAGHHATERYGAPAVAAHVAAQCGLEHQFIEIDNPA